MKITNGGTIRVQRTHPAKVVFLACTLVIGGCASRPTDLVAKDLSTHYWKWIAEQKSWVYFNSLGKQDGSVGKHSGLFFAQSLCRPLSAKDLTTGTETIIFQAGTYFLGSDDNYDTAPHAQAALEKTCGAK